MRYDITEPPHALLSPEARQLKKDELAEWNEVAEMLLDADLGDVYTDPEQVLSALRYVTMQVNLLVETGVELHAYTSTSDGGRSRAFREDMAYLPVHPVALAGFRRLADGGNPRGFRSVQSNRRGYTSTNSGTEAFWRASREQ